MKELEIAGESWLIRPSSWPILQSQMLVVSLDRALSHLLPIELSQALALPCEDTHMPTLEHTRAHPSAYTCTHRTRTHTAASFGKEPEGWSA